MSTTSAQPSTRARAILGVSRAPFLVLPVTLIIAGAGAAAYDGSFHLGNTVLALVGLVALHVAVNAFNEWSDFRRGIDLHTRRTPFSGGSGTLPAGLMGPAATFAWAALNSAIGAAVGVYFIITVGAAMVPIVVLGAITVLFYTDVLARVAVGEIAAGLGLGGLPVLGTALVQGAGVGPAAIVASIPAFFMTLNLLLLNEFPDEEADREGGRLNLVIALGRASAARVYMAAALGVPVTIAVGVALGWLPLAALLATLPSLLLRQPARWALHTPREDVPIPALGANVTWILLTNTTLGLVLGAAALIGS